MRTLTSVEAQNHFGELLDSAQREPVTITRRGRTVAFMVSPQDMEDLLDVRRKRGQALLDFEAYCAQATGRATRAVAALTDEEVNRLVHEAR